MKAFSLTFKEYIQVRETHKTVQLISEPLKFQLQSPNAAKITI